MIREDRFVISHLPYAVKPDSLTVIDVGGIYRVTIGAVWYRRRKGVTVACIGHLWDHQRTEPADADEFLERHDDGRYGGNCEGRWDGSKYWGAQDPDEINSHLKLLRPMLANYPEIPAGYVGWYVFERRHYVEPPIWLIDVDGVINATCKPAGWNVEPRIGYAHAAGTRYRLHWSPALIDRIRHLHTTGVVQARWCTTWCAYADQLERMWQLPPLHRTFKRDIKGKEASAAKLAAARQVLADGHRLIWTDDTETPTGGALYDELTADGQIGRAHV